MVELEQKNEALINIIKNVLCETCRTKTLKELSEIAGEAVAVKADGP